MKTLLINSILKVTLSIFIAFMLNTISIENATAQNVGINNPNPNAKALLDLSSTDKGFLPPRMSEAQKLAIFPAPDATAKGMIVYQTDLTEGFYYYDGTSWSLMSTEKSGWSLNGNAGTTPATNFIGTKDNQDVTFKTNNAEHMRLKSSGAIGIGTDTPTGKFHIKTDSYTGWQSVKLSEMGADCPRIGYYNDSTLNFIESAASPNNVDTLAYYNVFFSNKGNLMTIRGDGKIGFSNTQPSAQLSMPSTLGNKITLWGGYGNMYGMGIQPSLMQFFTNNASADIAFGFGSSEALTENVRFMGNGRVGFGTSNPGANLNTARVEIADNNGLRADLLMTTAGGGVVAKGFPQLVFHQSRGTLAAKLPSQNTDWTGVMVGRAYDGTNYGNTSAIVLGVDSAIAPGVIRGNIQFQTTGGSGSEKMRISSAGNVGIGTNTPNFPLSFNNNLGDKIALWGTSGDHYGIGIANYLLQIHTGISLEDIAFGYGSSANFTETMRIKGNGNMGVGTSSPSAKIHAVSSNGNAPMKAQSTISAGYSGIDFVNDAGALSGYVGYANSAAPIFPGTVYIGSPIGIPLLFSTSQTERMRILANGNIGMGIAAPTTKLHVSHSSAVAPIKIQNTAIAGYSGLDFTNDAGVLTGYVGYANSSAPVFPGTVYVGSPTAVPLVLATSQVERMRITPTGNVGFGTNNPTTKLEVNGFTKLGTDAPAIKVKKITGTTSSTQGSTISIVHGIADINKIVSVTALVDYGSGNTVHQAYTYGSGYEFNFFVTPTVIFVGNVAGNSGSILSKPVKIFITYEE